jgi:hypothetical protein
LYVPLGHRAYTAALGDAGDDVFTADSVTVTGYSPTMKLPVIVHASSE